MLGRQRSGSVLCPSCGKLVGVGDERCWNCGWPRPGLWGFAPALRRLVGEIGFLPIVLGGCAVLYLATLVADPGGIRSGGLLTLLAPSGESLLAFGASGALPAVQMGRWWTLLSAGWLHGGLLHIAFNLLWVRQLSPATAEIYGVGRTVILYVLSSAAGFFLSSAGGAWLGLLSPLLGGSPFSVSVGASAAIFGLLGALVYAGRRGVASQLGRQAWGYAVILFLFGFLMRGVDNWAHLGGFLGGYGLGRWLDPLKEERPVHLLAAAAALALTVLSIAASLLIPPALPR